MKNTIIGIVLAAIPFAACNSTNNKTDSTRAPTDTTQITAQIQQPSTDTQPKETPPLKDIVNSYLQMKNALANDNGNNAATAGKAIVDAIGELNISSFTAAQKKLYDDMADDLKENAEHIGDNAGKIEHQREHFDMLSQDMYELVKGFGGEQTLYKDFCPMYNNNKGAIWLSETKEIKNPYLGKKMPTCGSVKEEIK